MAFPELVRRTAEKKVAEFCERRIPRNVRDEIRLEFGCRGNGVTIFEWRPPWEGLPEHMVEWSKMKIALLCYDPSTVCGRSIGPIEMGAGCAIGTSIPTPIWKG